MPDAKRLDGLRIGEVSGVDHPAHLTEGWLVLKSLTGLSDEDMADVVAEAAEIAKAQSQSPSEEVAMSDENKTTDSTEDVLKSLPEPVRKMVQQFEDRAAAAEVTAATALTEVAKAREEKADADSIAKARSEFSNIPGLDAEEFGPALRKAAEAAPEAVAVITKALVAANSALGEESVLLKEVGSSVTPAAGSGSTYLHIQSLAKAAVASGDATTIEEGVAKALTENPGLYTEYLDDMNKKGA